VLDAVLIGANPSPGEGIGKSVIRREGIASGWPWLLWKTGLDGTSEVIITTDTGLTFVCTLSNTKQQPNSIHGPRFRVQPNGSRQLLLESGAHFNADNSYRASGTIDNLPTIADVVFVGPFPKQRLRPLHELYSDMVRKGLREQVNAILGDLIPGLSHFEVLTEGGTPVLNMVFADRAVPAILAGDGIALLLRLGFELAVQPEGVALLEEPEVHQHPGAIRQSARAIIAAVRRNIQVILTTHSLELIDAIVSESLDKDLEQMSLYGLVLQDGFLKSSRLAGPDVSFSRFEVESDLR
jgi:hypothetical protein